MLTSCGRLKISVSSIFLISASCCASTFGWEDMASWRTGHRARQARAACGGGGRRAMKDLEDRPVAGVAGERWKDDAKGRRTSVRGSSAARTRAFWPPDIIQAGFFFPAECPTHSPGIVQGGHLRISSAHIQSGLTPSGRTVQSSEYTVPVKHTPNLHDACVSRIEATPAFSSTCDSFHAVTGPVARATRVLARCDAAGCKQGKNLPRESTPEHRWASDGDGK